jgi:23S rRNA (adenine2503-C2)-methyltransferase
MKVYNVPTGKIAIINGEKGHPLEFLSIGDYGKEKNVKADFLGLTDEINGVPSGEIMPLEEKWVITMSTQYGCSMGCQFCDVPSVGHGINATEKDLYDQLICALNLHSEVRATKRLNVHYARMGEPTFNPNVLKFTWNLRRAIRPRIGRSLVHPVISTMLPRSNKKLMEFLNEWTFYIKNELFGGDAGLQFSINSTSDEQRFEMFNGNSLPLHDISAIGKSLIDPIGRKYALNFALADNYDIDAKKLAKLFSPKKFMAKITPLHKTHACTRNGISTTNGYEQFTPYRQAEEDLKREGFDVIVFVPSYDEDLGMITCGNAILSGKTPETGYTIEQYD